MKPYWRKPVVRNFRKGDGNVGIIRSPVRAIALTDLFSVEYNPYGWWQGLLNRIGCETNFACKAVKRGARAGTRPGLLRFYTFFGTAALFPILVPLAYLLAVLEAACGRGGAMTVLVIPAESRAAEEGARGGPGV